jgi:hypothetical protein
MARALSEHGVRITSSGVHRIASAEQLTTRRSVLEGIAPAYLGHAPSGDGVLPPRAFLAQLRFARELREVTDHARLPPLQFGVIQLLTSLYARRRAAFGVGVEDPAGELEDEYAEREVAQLRVRLEPVLHGKLAVPPGLLTQMAREARALAKAVDKREFETLPPEAKAALAEIRQRSQ